MSTVKVTRPVLRYHGGKFRLAPWMIGHFPAHRTYVEPFGGAASVLLRKPRSHSEVYNDMDGEIVGLFRVLRDPAQARELIRLVKLTPYARAEYDLSYITSEDPIEQARRTLFRSAAGFSSVAVTGRWRTGFRTKTPNRRTEPAGDWKTLPDSLEAVVERLRGVIIEQGPAAEVLAHYDGEDTLFYCDPPYLHETRYVRWSGEAYQHEMSDDDHRELARLLHQVQGMVIISGYASALYDELYAGWRCARRLALADGAKERTECLWISPRAQARAPQRRLL